MAALPTSTFSARYLERAISTLRGEELLRPSYIFAIQVSSVTVITKNTNAIPICLFVC